MAEETQVQPNQPEVTQQTNVENTGDTQVAAPTTQSLPEDSKERTKQRFDELTKQLTEERQSKRALEEALKTFQSQRTQKEETPESFIDPETGLLNEQALKNYQQRAIEAEKRANEAKALVDKFTEEQKKLEITRREEAEAKEAYDAHPDLNPTSKEFNKELHDFTTAIILKERYMNGNDLTFKQAADKAKEAIAKIVGDAKGEGAEEAIKQLDAKEQASLSVTGASNKRTDNLDELRIRSRMTGEQGVEAMMQRMKRLKQS